MNNTDNFNVEINNTTSTKRENSNTYRRVNCRVGNIYIRVESTAKPNTTAVVVTVHEGEEIFKFPFSCGGFNACFTSLPDPCNWHVGRSRITTTTDVRGQRFALLARHKISDGLYDEINVTVGCSGYTLTVSKPDSGSYSDFFRYPKDEWRPCEPQIDLSSIL